MKEEISITAVASISPLGESLEGAFEKYQQRNHCFTHRKYDKESTWVAPLPDDVLEKITELRNSDSKYQNLDNSVLYAIYASRKAIKTAGWSGENNFGINIGSSRGATALFEKFHEEYLQNGRTATLTSPTTTLGNISSWVGHDLQTKGPDVSHSITCSTALHSLLNGVAWIQGGMADKFLVGGSEAPLTPFTIAQLKALKIYTSSAGASSGVEKSYPCKALDLTKRKNTMVLGEAASMACLQRGTSKNTLAIIKGVGYATEPLEHNVSISTDAVCFQRSMKMALGEISPDEVDAIVMHAPGTIKGDLSEYHAIKKVFCNKQPFLTTNKWKVGHTFGASGMLSIEMAILMLQNQQVIKVPYVTYDNVPKTIQNVLVNAVGFGGNAVSVFLGRP
ncbi:beta-ketoacyl synthase [Maribacter sp. 4U21]|uniref:beta-ketoacyl synthase N-terminal-like domain-containing protein n=1 Tax=Maribacter sp. 4U21 TaxID=1889779 RepID=UPI000C145A6E|nr:beta-ketoacyl synthase N-terminal-like domain-containing protein [Maribacter sp. 4U21]PIB30903.1 beta-ketoacyl synthase [Maribacter sp. 4U21]